MKTIIELFETAVANYPDNVYLWEKKEGKYQGTSYHQTREIVLNLAAGLIDIGFKKGDRAALVADGRNDWIISELGMLYTGGINVPLSIRLEINELVFRLKHSGAKFIFVSRLQARKIEDIREELPDLEKVVYIDSKENPGKNDVDYNDLIKRGKESRIKNQEKYDKVWQNIQPNDVANISYTSGTTADPKGIMLSQLNYAANVVQSNSLMDLKTEWKTLAILPWDHAFAHTTCLYVFMYKGASIASVEIGNTPLETLKNIPNNIKEIKPHIMMSVPAYSKTFRKNIEAGIKAKGDTLYKIFKFALKVAYKYNGIGHDKGKGLRILLKPLLSLFNTILFKKIQAGFGGNLLFFIGGGAILDIEIIVDSDNNILQTGEKGEICIKGDNVMLGYWKNPTATAETIKDGWLHTGDMGYVDKDGFLFVLGRFKSLLIGNDGEKYSPEGIEDAILIHSPHIQQVMLHNNQNPYTVGMIVPDMDAINRVLKQRGIAKGSEGGISEALKIIQNDINQLKKGGKHEGLFPERWMPSTIAVLPEPFTAENKQLNAMLKIVRGKITERYQSELEFLYTPKAKNIENDMNFEAIKKWNA